jgi:hypothetical protein
MGRTHAELSDALREFIERQQMFFVATAPLAADGHVNLSPKGLESFRVLDAKTVAYLDLAGSGIETVAHLRENGRIVLMFCAFAGGPKIVRLHGRGRAVEPQDAEWPRYSSLFPSYTSARTVIVVNLERVSDSCGYGVPLFEYVGQRDQLVAWAEKQGGAAIERYKSEKNRESIDGLAGLRHV